MHALKLRQVGRSTGAIFPKELLTRLNVKEGDELHVIETENGILLTPSDPLVAKQIETMKRAMHDYNEVFEALAK